MLAQVLQVVLLQAMARSSKGSWATIDTSALDTLVQPSRFDPDEGYWYQLGASTALTPASSSSQSRQSLKPPRTVDSAAAGPKASRLSRDDLRKLLLGDESCSRGVCGDMHSSFADGKCVAHPTSSCKHCTPSGEPCWSGLWTRDSLRLKRMQLLNYSQEDASTAVFHKLQSMVDIEGSKVWKYYCNGRPVCQHTFLIENVISTAQLYKLQGRIQQGCRSAHEKHEAGDSLGKPDSSGPSKSLAITAWYTGYSHVVGCWMPDDQMVVVPRRERTDEYEEYVAAFGEEAAAYPYFCRVLRTAPELEDIVRARPKLNFQDCTKCSDSNSKIKAALRKGERAVAEAAKAERAAHISEERKERLRYYDRRELGRDPQHDSVSLIIDKCDSTKTTVPWFKQSPGAWWSALRKECLCQHLLGVLVHDRPDKIFLYTVNDTIKGDANLNIEGIRRTLADLYETEPMPKTVYIQADNASDNKCWAMLAFLGTLVFHGYTNDVYLSFLLVGHTHEDIDQRFSIIARHFRSIDRVTTPQHFEAELAQALQAQAPVLGRVRAVLDWTSWLSPHIVSPRPKGIQHASLPLGTEEAPKGGAPAVDASATDAPAVDTRSPHTFHIHFNPQGSVVLHYKELSDDPTWLPAIPNSKPLQTDEEGIVLFQTPPPEDPMVNPPKEAPFARF